MTIKLGVPSKGRLMEKTFDWFGARGVSLQRTGSEREYAGTVDGIDGVSLILLSAGEIPRELASGLGDLDAAAAAFRAHHGFRLRIATKYHRLVRDYLRVAGVADYALIDSQGATEGTVKNETAEAIADITSSGETLRANHLKILSDGLILKSQATLWRSRTAELDDKQRETLTSLLERLT